MQFTDRLIQALDIKTDRYDVREKSGEGFAIRIFPSGEKSWVFFYSYEGRKRRMTLGKYPDLTLANARKFHREALTLLALGKDPGLIKQNEKHAASIASSIEDLVIEYIEKWAKPRKRSWAEDLRILNKDVLSVWGKRKAKDITKRDVLLMLDKIKEREAPISANRTLAVVRRMFNFAIERDIVVSSPCLTIKAPAKENRRERQLTQAEIRSFWLGLDNASTEIAAATKLALKLQLATAQRKGEIISSVWSEIDLVSGWWTIPAIKAKNECPHRVPLSRLALRLLQEIKEISGNSIWLFPSPINNSHIHGTSVDHAVRRNMKIFTDVKHFTPHDLRRTAASHMTAMGISRLIVSKILNHVDGGITAIYDRHSYDTEKRRALEAWGERLEQILFGEKTGITNVISFAEAV